MNYLKPFATLRQISLALALTLLAATTVQAEAPTSPSRLALNKNGIKVWTYQTPNNPAFNYRATTVLNTSLTSAAAVILDTDSLTDWVPYVSEIDLIERNHDNGTFILRMQLNLPFPLQKRDIVVQGKITQSADGTVTIKNKAISDKRVPARPNVIRLTHYEGDWTLKPLAANKVEVTTTGYADPGGAIPLSIANHFVQQQPYQMLGSMKNYVKNTRYQQAKLDFIHDPYAK